MGGDVRIILFDIDGTLITAGKAPRRAFTQAFQEVLGVVPVTAGVRTHGATDPQIRHDTAMSTFGRSLTDSEYARFNARYVELLYREIDCEAEYQGMPGVGDLLEALSQHEGVALGLQTGNLEEAVPAKLNRGGLTRYFACGGFGTDSSSRPEIIRTAIARTRDAYQIASAQQTDVIVIGDAPQDVGAAMEVGVRSIAVTTGIYTAKELAAAGPCTVLADLSDVQGVISLLGV